MKTNNVINWFVVTNDGNIVYQAATRKIARYYKNFMNMVTGFEHRIAKTVVTK